MNDATGLQARVDQVLDDLLLAIDGDRPAAGEITERDTMRGAIEPDLDAVMDEAFTLQPAADTRLDHEVDGVLFEDAGAHTMGHVLATAILEHDAVDAAARE